VLQDIAEATGVSVSTVSLVLRGNTGPSAETAAKVTEAAETLGYRVNRVASQLSSTRTYLLGVTMTPGNPYHGDLVEEIQAVADERGYEVLVATVTRSHDEQRSIETLVDSNCEALVLLNPVLPTDVLVKSIDGIPTVLVGRPLEHPGIDIVRSADVAALELLVDHLTTLGHTQIAHIDGGPLYIPSERVRGYLNAMQARGLEPLVLAGGETRESGQKAVAGLVKQPTVTAAIVYNDQCAVGVMDELYRLGIRVPHDISITGFDDDPLARLTMVNLTTINPSPRIQARLAVEAAIERTDGLREHNITQVPEATLIIRGSTAPPSPAASRSAAGSSPVDGLPTKKAIDTETS
jgi:DNA-binding LacI/PurR family transcriptional regulator